MKQGMWLLPTLNRPRLLQEFFNAYRKSQGTTPGLVLIDEVDYAKNKAKYDILPWPQNWGKKITKGVTMGDKFRETFNMYKDWDWVGILNDDHRPKTLYWDQEILKHLETFTIIGTNDGETPDTPWQLNKILCGAIVLSGPLLRSLGYMFPPGLNHLYSDNAWQYIGERLEIIKTLPHVCVHHDHAYIHGRKDSTTLKVNSKESWEHDERVYNVWLKERADLDIAKVYSTRQILNSTIDR